MTDSLPASPQPDPPEQDPLLAATRVWLAAIEAEELPQQILTLAQELQNTLEQNPTFPNDPQDRGTNDG